MLYARPDFKQQYENYIGGKWTPPVEGNYFDDVSSIDGSVIAKAPRSTAKDIDVAIAAGEKAFESWRNSSATERSNMLFKIAERIEQNLEHLARVECWESGKAIRETLAADLPLVIDHFRYFGAVIRGEAGDVSDLDANTVSMEVHEPLGAVGRWCEMPVYWPVIAASPLPLVSVSHKRT